MIATTTCMAPPPAFCLQRHIPPTRNQPTHSEHWTNNVNSSPRRVPECACGAGRTESGQGGRQRRFAKHVLPAGAPFPYRGMAGMPEGCRVTPLWAFMLVRVRCGEDKHGYRCDGVTGWQQAIQPCTTLTSAFVLQAGSPTKLLAPNRRPVPVRIPPLWVTMTPLMHSYRP